MPPSLCLHSGHAHFATFGSRLFKFGQLSEFSNFQSFFASHPTLSSLRSRPVLTSPGSYDFAYRSPSHFAGFYFLWGGCALQILPDFVTFRPLATFGSPPFCHSHFFLKAPAALSGAQCRRKERRGGVRSELELLRAEPRSAIARAGAYVPPRTVS